MATIGRVTGGARTEAFIRRAFAASGIRRIEVGFYATARYPPVYTGTGPRAGKPRTPVPVTNVALWNELGTKTAPPRPFFKRALAGAEPELLGLLKTHLRADDMAVSPLAAGQIGQFMKGRIQKSITTLRTPPNAPRTVELKRSSNPLIDVAFMRSAVTYRVFRTRD